MLATSKTFILVMLLCSLIPSQFCNSALNSSCASSLQHFQQQQQPKHSCKEIQNYEWLGEKQHALNITHLLACKWWENMSLLFCFKHRSQSKITQTLIKFILSNTQLFCFSDIFFKLQKIINSELKHAFSRGMSNDNSKINYI